MKNIYINTNDVLIKDSFSNLFKSFGFIIVNKAELADLVINDFDDRINILDKDFLKPIDFFDVVKVISDLNIIYFNGIEVFPFKKTISKNNEVVNFTDMEFLILSLLMNNKEGIETDDILINVFGRVSESNLKSLSTHIYNLRRKLLKISENKDNIVLKNSRYILNL